MTAPKPLKPTGFKVEFWTCISGRDRKHRNRHYTTAEGMVRAGARWEAKGGNFWCRYWNGLNTWTGRGFTPPSATLEAVLNIFNRK